MYEDTQCVFYLSIDVLLYIIKSSSACEVDNEYWNPYQLFDKMLFLSIHSTKILNIVFQTF